ncbi:MAG: dTDP-4-dehydrorhamnose reductase [Rikenellaceae bacterium]|nr:dTDP-4-dehydrorhamnose reductase [Rikenellaceae bacterium]
MMIGVTGANGQLGCSLRKISGEFPDFGLIFSDLPQIDITDKNGVRQWIARNGVQALINCAAYTEVDRAETEPDQAWKINALGPAVLAEICAESGIKLIHISTDYVFDGTARTPYPENHRPHPVNVYGFTKLQGETAVRQSGCEALVVRTSWLYSEFGRNFVRTILRLGAEKSRLRVIDDQVGSPTYATDLARALLTLLRKGFTGYYEVYHYCGEGTTSWYDFARIIFGMTGNPITVTPIESADYPSRATRPSYSVLDTEKIIRRGIPPIPFWTESLRECLTHLNR